MKSRKWIYWLITKKIFTIIIISSSDSRYFEMKFIHNLRYNEQ